MLRTRICRMNADFFVGNGVNGRFSSIKSLWRGGTLVTAAARRPRWSSVFFNGDNVRVL